MILNVKQGVSQQPIGHLWHTIWILSHKEHKSADLHHASHPHGSQITKRKLFSAFLHLTAAYDSVQREKVWAHLQNVHVPKCLRSIVRSELSSLTEKGVGRNHGNSSTEAGMPTEPSYALFSQTTWAIACQTMGQWQPCLQGFVNNHTFPLWIGWQYCTYYQYCPSPPAPAWQILQLHDCERADAKYAQEQNHGFLLLQPSNVPL